MKHLLTLTLLCFGLLAQAQIPSYVPTNGLVGWWPFNGNANDESGNGNHGTVNGATLAADRFGNAGKAYSFDGISSFIQFPCNITTNTTTASVWFKSNSNGFQSIIDNDIAPLYGNNIILNYANSGNKIDLLFHDGVFRTNATFQINSIYHAVAVWNDSNCKLYLNGVLVDSFAHATGFNERNIYRLGKHSSNSAFFLGIIDDVALYNRALSAAEVQQLYLGACAKPTFTAQPQNKSVAQGQTTTFAVQVDSAISFQWQMNQGYGQNWVNLSNSSQISGVTTNSLTVEGRYQIDGAQFRCIATSCKADTSNAATLTVTSLASAAAGTVAGVPGLINYQGSALDSAGKPMKNQTISLKLSVLDSSSTGAAVYVETHTAATNGSGHFAIQIGGGTAILGTFDSVGWANGRNKYLKTELSQNGTWVNLGTSQLVSVPYALVSGKAMEATTASFLRDNSGNAYQLQTVNGQPSLVTVPGSGSSGSFACGQSVNYAGENYPTVQIGTQCWFQKNFNVGTMILGVNDQTNNSVLEKYCYNNDTANCAIYGGLYQWAEAVQYQNGASNTTSPSPAFSGNVKGMCPTGWHIPSDGEFCTLTTYIDVTVNCNANGFSGTDAGGKMKSTSGLWASPNTGATNSSGFSAIANGSRSTTGSFNPLSGTAFWTVNNGTLIGNSIYRSIDYNSAQLYRNETEKIRGCTIRCLKD